MPISFLHGDLFAAASARTGLRALAFGADCAGTMDAGIAIAFRNQWPALAEAFHEHCKGGAMQLGDVFTFRDGDTIVYALGIMRAGGKPKVSHFERAMKTMLASAAAEGVPVILLPRIGAGKNGLDWMRVKRVLTEVGTSVGIELVVFEQFIRERPKEPGEPG